MRILTVGENGTFNETGNNWPALAYLPVNLR